MAGVAEREGWAPVVGDAPGVGRGPARCGEGAWALVERHPAIVPCAEPLQSQIASTSLRSHPLWWTRFPKLRQAIVDRRQTDRPWQSLNRISLSFRLNSSPRSQLSHLAPSGLLPTSIHSLPVPIARILPTRTRTLLARKNHLSFFKLASRRLRLLRPMSVPALPLPLSRSLMSPLAYSDYFLPQTHHHHPHPLHHHPQHSAYSSQSIILHHPHQHPLARQMQQPPSPPIPIDPSLALYPPQYYGYQQQQQQQHMPPPNLTLSASLSSPSSHGSETVGTPPNDTISISGNANGKRPASSNSTGGSNKRPRPDDDGEAQSPNTEKGDEPKAKPTRGSRYVPSERVFRFSDPRAGHAQSVDASR